MRAFIYIFRIGEFMAVIGIVIDGRLKRVARVRQLFHRRRQQTVRRKFPENRRIERIISSCAARAFTADREVVERRKRIVDDVLPYFDGRFIGITFAQLRNGEIFARLQSIEVIGHGKLVVKTVIFRAAPNRNVARPVQRFAHGINLCVQLLYERAELLLRIGVVHMHGVAFIKMLEIFSR